LRSPRPPASRRARTNGGRFDAWPPREAVANHVYFAPQGALSTKSPGTATSGSDAYTSDPKKPVPYLGRPSAEVDATYMVEDQRFASRRPDVLVLREPEAHRGPDLGGPRRRRPVGEHDRDRRRLRREARRRSSATTRKIQSRTLRASKMGGYQALVRLEVMRGKFRDGFDAPKPFVPGQPTRVRFSLADVLHTFRPGHRLMVQVQSSLFRWSTAIRRRSATSTRPKKTTFARRRIRCFALPSTPRASGCVCCAASCRSDPARARRC
jgi:predicted acyl esterase